ncbi:hypothetical protein MMC34_007894 [Xylographa carneopallida]|nr:hypothetical protein [Xylographa carneopallida]
MRLLEIGACALAIVSVDAFENTSPFLFFSSSEILASSPQIATAASLSVILNLELEKCPSEIYIIVSQPGATTLDYKSQRSTPYLRRCVSGKDKHVRSSFTVSEVLGEIDTTALSDTLEQQCGAGTLNIDASSGSGLFDIVDDMKPRIIKVDFPAPTAGKDRSTTFRTNDLFFSNLLDLLPSPNYTVIYTTTPASESYQQHTDIEPTMYEMDKMMSPLVHIDLKRDISMHTIASGNSTNTTSLPLFERYQYFTPGLFMGLFAGSLLLSILYVAISAVSSLQVSYASFDRENGPTAQKKLF